MSMTIEALTALVSHYGYVVLFLVSIIEGPIVSVIAGFLAAQNILSFVLAYVIMVFADVVGDLVWYAVGYYSVKHPRVRAHLERNPKRVEYVTAQIQKNLAKTLFIAKYTQTGMVAHPAAGAAHAPIKAYILYNTIATLPKVLILMLVGYFFGYSFRAINMGLRIGSGVIALLTLVVLGIYYRTQSRIAAEPTQP